MSPRPKMKRPLGGWSTGDWSIKQRLSALAAFLPRRTEHNASYAAFLRTRHEDARKDNLHT